MKLEDEITTLLNEFSDLSIRQREILIDLGNLVNDADKNENVLAALENCLKALDNQEKFSDQMYKEFEKAAYNKALHNFNL